MEPQTCNEVKSESSWIEAMKAEIKTLEDDGTWIVVDLPKGKVPNGCKWFIQSNTTQMAQLNISKLGLWEKVTISNKE